MGSVRLLVNQAEAAAMLGMSVNTFKRQVRPYIGRVEANGMRFPVTELQKWIDRETLAPIT
jgi:hypothetical protein